MTAVWLVLSCDTTIYQGGDDVEGAYTTKERAEAALAAIPHDEDGHVQYAVVEYDLDPPDKPVYPYLSVYVNRVTDEFTETLRSSRYTCSTAHVWLGSEVREFSGTDLDAVRQAANTFRRTGVDHECLGASCCTNPPRPHLVMP